MIKLPLFSILLPSRDRLNLLTLALESIIDQDFKDYEVIVSDNASESGYRDLIKSLSDKRIKYQRTESLVSVTENWNNALNAARGDYVIMLGDDDALTPGLLKKLSKIIKRFRRPDVIYMKAYHYLYSGVNIDAPDGYLRAITNSPLFENADVPYRLEIEQARLHARAGVSFNHTVSFNAQHFVWRRQFTQNLNHRFFEPPYPDYFACFFTFMKAADIVVVPEPSIIIGISKQSFGYFFLNNRQDEGALAFAGETLRADQLSRGNNSDIIASLDFPGPMHYRNWLLASLQFINKVDQSCHLDLERYYKIQIVETLSHCFSSQDKNPMLPLAVRRKWKRHWSFVRHAWSAMSEGAKKSQLNISRANLIMNEIRVYYPCAVQSVEMESHKDIMDAYRTLQTPEAPSYFTRLRNWLR